MGKDKGIKPSTAGNKSGGGRDNTTPNKQFMEDFSSLFFFLFLYA
jgi:hypothetical protein